MTSKNIARIPAVLAIAATCAFGTAAALGQGAVPVVTGSAHTMDLVPGWGFSNLTVNVVEHRDGSVSGQVEVTRHGTGIRLHLEIQCLVRINDHAVILGGVVTDCRNTPLDFEGYPSIIVVSDGGVGRDAIDQVSQLYVLPPLLLPHLCEIIAEDPEHSLEHLYPTVRGNLTVR